MKNQRTVLVHLPRTNIEAAFKSKAVIEKLIEKMPMKIHNLEVGMGDDNNWVCGFALYEPTEQQVAEVVGWLCDYGFGIPKLYELGG